MVMDRIRDTLGGLNDPNVNPFNPFGGIVGGGGGDDDPPDVPQDPREREKDALLAKMTRGEDLDAQEQARVRELFTPEEMAYLTTDSAQPGAPGDLDFSALNEQGGGGGGGGGLERVRPDLSEAESMADALNATLLSVVQNGFDPDSAGDYAQAVAQLASAEQKLRETDAGAVRGQDGTLISPDMVQQADPVTRAQLMQQLENNRWAAENEARQLVNQYQLQEYDLHRGVMNDQNALIQQDFQNRSNYIRDRLAVDDLTIQQAATALERQLAGLGESRARTNLETQTALEAAPWGTVGGKASFTGGDLGGLVMKAMENAGIENPEQANAIRFPGATTLDPGQRMLAYDEMFGVQGGLERIPGVTVQPEDVGLPPAFRDPGAIEMPQMSAPTMPRAFDPITALREMQIAASAGPRGIDPSIAYQEAQRRARRPTGDRGRPRTNIGELLQMQARPAVMRGPGGGR